MSARNERHRLRTMDITSFSDDGFDTKAWINNILKAGEATEKKENHTMSLVMKLQLYVQQVNNALEDTSQQVLASLPKIMRDTKSLQQEAVVLKEKMATVREEIVKIETETGNSINSIERLDRVKTRLQEAKQGLHESDNWTVLVNYLEEVFDSKNIESISKKLLSMQQSLKLLVNISDYEDRRLQLEGLKNRLEAIASPSIVQAFTSNDTEQSAFYARIFRSMGRSSQLLKYYHRCQKDLLIKRWRSQLEVEQDESVAQWIHNYFNMLLSNWHTQFKWFSGVFPEESADDMFMDVYTDVLSSLDPSMNECIDAALKQTAEKLPFLYEIKQIVQQFSENCMKIIEGSDANQNKRLQFTRIIYSPLVPYVSKYAAYEQAHLSQKLSAMACIKEELPDTIQALGFSINPVFDLARESQRRCERITESCGYCGLLIAARAFFVSYADQYRVALRQIDRSKGKKEDWNTFQLCLSLLQNSGDVLNNLQRFERELTSALLELNDSGRGDYRRLLLNDGELREFESLVKCVTEGTQLSLLDYVITEFTKLCSDIHHTTYQVVFAPIAVHLEIVQNAKTWAQYLDSSVHSNDLPDYSFTPQEYITQIGQYLMTLPQHLEPFLFRENPSLSCALKAADAEYGAAEEGEGAMADIFLKVVARGTCQVYCDKILSICELSNHASRQLAHDIGYLENVLEDLGLSLLENLKQLMALLKLPSDQYQTQSTRFSARYVAAIRQMRNIASS